METYTFKIHGQDTPMAEGDLVEYLEQYGRVIVDPGRNDHVPSFLLFPWNMPDEKVEDYLNSQCKENRQPYTVLGYIPSGGNLAVRSTRITTHHDLAEAVEEFLCIEQERKAPCKQP